MTGDVLPPRLRERVFGDRRVAVTTRPLGGGLDGADVHVVTAVAAGGREEAVTWVRKRPTGPAARERAVYRELVALHVPDLAPRVVDDEGTAALWLEHLPPQGWPWRDVDATAMVLERVAALHELPPGTWTPPAWDYEAELAISASTTLELMRALARDPLHGWLVRDILAPAAWLVEHLPGLRRELASCRPFAHSIIHGDLHPGNVLHRAAGGRVEPVLIDWSRARVGCALEDVASWLHSVGMWEPEARRRHDTLFARYLVRRGLRPQLTPELRRVYWLAGASNALAGALRYHLAVASDPAQAPTTAACHASSARTWQRVLRRARDYLR